MSTLDPDSAEKHRLDSGKSGVIYHPHPLNGNFNTISQLKPQIPLAADSARTSQPRPSQGGMNNRNSRKNLKPLGKKKPSYNGPLQQLTTLQKGLKLKNPSRQYQTQNNTNSIVPALALQQLELQASGSRDRGMGFAGNMYTSGISTR